MDAVDAVDSVVSVANLLGFHAASRSPLRGCRVLNGSRCAAYGGIPYARRDEFTYCAIPRPVG